jgi:hypothetical protein
MLLVLALLPATGTLAHADALERMQIDNLRATHAAVELLRQDLQPVSLQSGYTDYRGVMHVHSHLSHDSRSQVPEIIDAAHKVGVQIVMFTEHPADHYDYYTDGHRGLRDGVLLVPGAESGGLLSFPTASVKDRQTDGPQGLADVVVENGGLAFLCHLEERMDWNIAGLTGNEIYNTHADFKDEARFAKALRNPATLLQIGPAVREFPQETFGALLDYPADYLKRWDELCQTARHTGVAANDSHHNQGVKAVIDDTGKVRLEDRLGEVLFTLDPEKVAFVKALAAGKKSGDVIFELDLDPYERSFRHVCTHFLMNELTEEAVREALRAGRVYVSFDWLADPTGFVFQAAEGNKVHPMGSEVAFTPGLQVQAAAPLPGNIRLIRDGAEVASQSGREFEHTLDAPGIYRAEVWLNLPDGPKIWILSNPIYVRD